MPSVRISCLRQTISHAGQNYPVFVGFSSADDLSRIAEAPAFTPRTSHADICANILNPPVKDWQRPLIEARVDTIADVYNRAGELMPNPVLICENATNSSRSIHIDQQRNGTVPTNIWDVEVGIPAAASSKPLWILDGQHRIQGLSRSSQKASALPVVLLLNQDATVYSPTMLAKIFAQVTTEATPLMDLHQEWLTFAFRLDSYDRARPHHAEATQAMEAAAKLCREPVFGTPPLANPFHNCVRFNDHDPHPPGPAPGGFRYTCIELKELFFKHYYDAAASRGHLSPDDLCCEFIKAFNALTAEVSAPQQNTVFFGSATGHEQKIMQDAFICGVLAALLQHGPGIDWRALLTTLQFALTNWDFKPWVVSLNGTKQTMSRKLAIDVFTQAFRDMRLPTSPGNLADYLQGNNARVTFAFSNVTTAGRPARSGRSHLDVSGGQTLSQGISPAKHVKVSFKSSNIAQLELVDAHSPPASPILIAPKGHTLKPSRDRNPLTLDVKMHHYGGTMNQAKLTLNW